MTSRPGTPAIAAAASTGVASGLAIGLGDLWWVVVPVALVAQVVTLGSRLPRPPAAAVVTTAAVMAATLTGALSYPNRLAGGVNAAIVALVLVALALAVASWRAARALEQAELARGWQLARALEAERESALAHAVLTERVRLAGQVHDRIGHRLNHVVVRVGLLRQDPALSDEQRAALETLRADLADVVDEVGDTVVLLDSGRELPEGGADPVTVLERARRTGSDVEADLAALESCPPEVTRVLADVLAETLANAARHAPGRRVAVESSRRAGTVTLEVRNPATGEGRPGAGTGLRRAAARVELAGGSLDVHRGDPFVVTAVVPCRGVVGEAGPV